MTALGVDRETVIGDYALTQQLLEARVPELQAEAMRSYGRELPPAFFGARPETMADFLGALDARYGFTLG